jgi:hypothetical protein
MTDLIVRAAVASVVIALSSVIALGQCAGDTESVGCVLPTLFGEDGLVLTGAVIGHEGHFTNDTFVALSPLSTAVGAQLALLPLASPASGFVYMMDPITGGNIRGSQNLGSILSERAETIGRGRFHVGFAFQRYSFDSLDGFDLDDGTVPFVLGHQDDPGSFDYEKEVVVAETRFDFDMNQVTFFSTYGLTDRIDVSVAVPVVQNSLRVSADATLHRVDYSFRYHAFGDISNPSDTGSFSNSGSSTGIGDITVRGKSTLYWGERMAIAVATDVRLPSGDPRNYRGAGALGVKPFAIVSTQVGRAAPHVNVGYQWNGESVLATGDIAGNTKADLPDQFSWIAGTDIGINRNITAAFDLVGQYVIDAPRATLTTFTTQASEQYPSPNPVFTPATDYPDTTVIESSFHILDGSAGVKFAIGDRMVAIFNAVFKLNDGGLRDKFSPSGGMSYTFD